MGTLENIIALDSQCYTYLIEGLASAHEPSSAVAAEKLALIRIFFYQPKGSALMIGPTVTEEYLRIKREDKLANHQSWAASLIGEFQPSDPKEVERVKDQLFAFHDDIDDCKVVADCVVFGAQTLLTFDLELLNRLADKVSVPRIKKPTENWNELNIERGSRPTLILHRSNPLSNETWWRW